MQITINHHGYHGWHQVTVRSFSVRDGWAWVSPRVARRINRAVCLPGDCQCGSRIACEVAQGAWAIPLPRTEAEAEDFCAEYNYRSIQVGERRGATIALDLVDDRASN